MKKNNNSIFLDYNNHYYYSIINDIKRDNMADVVNEKQEKIDKVVRLVSTQLAEAMTP